jgi:glycerol-3-phosphate dehydrogenase (NAD(P)+)
MSEPRKAVVVVGAGQWGVALASAAARKGGEVLLHTRRAVEVSPAGVEVVRDPAVAARARIVVLAVPSSAVREVVESLAPHLDERQVVVHGVRGLVGEKLETISDVVRTTTRAHKVGALGGPVLAAALLAGSPCALVVGATDGEVHEAMLDTFGGPLMRVYSNRDLRGIEWASALIGCLTVAVGYTQQIGVSPTLIATAITRGVQEAARITAAAGGNPQTLLGLAGFGDLLASITQRERPEILLGAALARGRTVEEAATVTGQRVEAIELVPRLVHWCDQRGVRAPIFAALAERVFRGVPSEDIVHEMMTLPVEDEG